MKADYGFGKQYRITKTDEYSSVFRLRCAKSGEYFQLFGRPNGLANARIGLVVSRKVAKQAVQRNYMKRVVREFFRHNRSNYSGIDIVVRVRQRFGRDTRPAALAELASMIHKLQVKCAS